MDKKIIESYDKLLSYAVNLTKNKPDAEDLVHDVIVKALENKSRFEHGTNFGAWLNVILFNTFVNNHRKKKLKERYKLQDFNRSTPAIIETKLHLDYLHKIIDQGLNRGQSECLLLRSKGYTYEEIVNMTNTTMGTVKSRIHLARKKLEYYR